MLQFQVSGHGKAGRDVRTTDADGVSCKYITIPFLFIV